MIGNPPRPPLDPRQDLPRPLSSLPAARLAGLAGVMTDIDDTLTRDGALDPAAGAALAALRAAAIPVIAITGRPLGWSVPFARTWPVAAIVAENGAVALIPDDRGEVDVVYAQDAVTRGFNAGRLAKVAERVLRGGPGATLARDSEGRETDIAIDHAEFARLDEAQIARVVELMREEGMNATVSSIHVNGWFGSHDKMSGARWIVWTLYREILDDATAAWIYVGDSANDQAMFEAFPLSVGVANLLGFAPQLRVWPAYLAAFERGAGFAEVARALIEARNPPSGAA